MKIFLHFVAGFAGWTLLEYLFHRFISHRGNGVFSDKAHHSNPENGGLRWSQIFGALAVLLVLVAQLQSWWVVGFYAGFMAYLIVHKMLHQSSLTLGRLREHHESHHANPKSYFGVITGFWDFVFGTQGVCSSCEWSKIRLMQTQHVLNMMRPTVATWRNMADFQPNAGDTFMLFDRENGKYSFHRQIEEGWPRNWGAKNSVYLWWCRVPDPNDLPKRGKAEIPVAPKIETVEPPY